jgi:hypothetical protein
MGESLDFSSAPPPAAVYDAKTGIPSGRLKSTHVLFKM